jgi:imidazolonepropionase-like amidohydrolase
MFTRLTTSVLLLASLGASQDAAASRQPTEQVLAVKAARFLTMDTDPIYHGVMLVKGSKITAIGTDIEIPAGAEVLDLSEKTVSPGFVDIHHHVASGGFGDINDMVYAINIELRAYDAVKPSTHLIKQTVAGGVTTTLFIPGSGTNLSGFGVLLKMSGGPLEEIVIRKLGAMKVAQGYNPERRSGDMGASRMGMSWHLHEALERGRAYAQEWADFNAGKGPKPKLQPDLEQLRQVFERKVPVIIHTAGARDCITTARMFQDVHNVWMILSHGTFDGHWAASALAKRKTPVNLGPRMYQFTKEGRFQGIADGYYRVGCTDLSINTDAPVIAPEQLLLQAAMASRLGLPYEAALKALTIIPARQVGIDDRVGSLTPGKDADFIVTNGDPLDPRYPAELVYIEGKPVYRSGDVP